MVKLFSIAIVVLIACCSEIVVSAHPQGYNHQSPIFSTGSYVNAIGFLSGRMTNFTYGKSYIEFHAQHVFFLALALYGCSVA